MNLTDFSLWTMMVMFPGFLLSRLFMFISGGWQDLLLRLFVSHCAAALCIGNLAIMISRAEALPHAASLIAMYMGAQFAWYGLDMIRYNPGNRVRRRLSMRRPIAALRFPADQAAVEPAE